MKTGTLCLSLFACAIFMVGCSKPDSDTATTNPPATTATTTGGSATAGAATTAGDPAGATTTTGGDASGNSLVGKWDMTNNPAAATTYEFKDDGTCEIVVTSEAQKMTITSTETYKVDGDKITQQVTDIKEASDDASKKGDVDKANAALAEVVKKSPSMDGTITWKDKDNAVLKVNQPAMGSQPAKEMEVDLKRKAE